MAPATTARDDPVTAAEITKTTAATTDPAEINRVIQIVNTNTTDAMARATGASTPKAPAAVATPLPPRNLSHTG
jgi:hypothetical protein